MKRLCLVSLILVLAALGGRVYFGWGIVEGESMMPTLPHHAPYVFNRKATPRLGDVIVAYYPEEGALVIKRVYEISEEGKYLTAGDNLWAYPDSRFIIAPENVIGVVCGQRDEERALWLRCLIRRMNYPEPRVAKSLPSPQQ
ncbi:MAG TPA: hypothetical protein EYP85_01930 [Armatimonadetes bacterium]|nr:hypothetical protein [Armatimonadota bacterium]